MVQYFLILKWLTVTTKGVVVQEQALDCHKAARRWKKLEIFLFHYEIRYPAYSAFGNDCQEKRANGK